MGAPVLLGGVRCEINRGAFGPLQRQTSIWRRNADPAAYTVLIEVAAELRRGGYDITKPKRGKQDDVRLRCPRGSRYIEIIVVVSTPELGEAFDFGIEAWGYTKVHNNDVNRELAADWERLATVVGHVLTSRFAAKSVKRLSAKEIDGWYAAKGKA